MARLMLSPEPEGVANPNDYRVDVLSAALYQWFYIAQALAEPDVD